MARKKNRMSQEVNAGSMADIAFLLLIFFLVTTTIASDKGILNVLPPKLDPNNPPPEIDKNERNIFTILVNANDQLLVEGEYAEPEGLDEEIKLFVLNFGQPDEEASALYNSLPASLRALSQRDPESSDHPGEAVVSIKTNRGTSYERFLEVFDLAKKAYFDIYAARVNLTTDEYRALSGKDAAEQALIDKGKENLPMAISIAEPDKIGS
ncbi:biopolymer transporter ExbD [Algoriphagus sp.]|uniref:ExbD/TolR family protein n=1 Tax=Algoriphagus sp. TaxID=1872435 RepID=UPI00261D6DD0|nr:biopolymer transporter ExbD [Algoriphagus sp.]